MAQSKVHMTFQEYLRSVARPLNNKRKKRSPGSGQVTKRGSAELNGGKCQEGVQQRATSKNISNHEALIRKILGKKFKVPIPKDEGLFDEGCLGDGRNILRQPLYDPKEPGALVLYTPPELTEHEKLKIGLDKQPVHVVVDPALSKVLQPHQREGVKFMYECVMGQRIPDNYGCILADEKCMGKTLQCITLIWTLLKQGPDVKPIIDKAIVVTPSFLVENWHEEINKWLPGRVNVLAIDSGSKEQVEKDLEGFMNTHGYDHTNPILIISYETFRLHANVLHRGEIGLVLCDEGNRLKNSDNEIYQALMGLNAKRRVLVSSMPIHNNLREYYNIVHFINREILGTTQQFKHEFETTILRGQNFMATSDERQTGQACLEQLSSIVDSCLIRRTCDLRSKYLPTKREQVICVGLSEVQKEMYSNFLNSDAVNCTSKVESGSSRGNSSALYAIKILRMLCNHPDLVFSKVEAEEDGFQRAKSLFPKDYNPRIVVMPELSGKIAVLDCLLAYVKSETQDKVVLVSNYAMTLDLFERLFQRRGYKYIRVSGNMSMEDRAKLADKFNQPTSSDFIFMLSSDTGVYGLNLIGANRLVIVDPDWNLASDNQAICQLWRDGQIKQCYIYRLLCTGTIEEKIFQKQASKRAFGSSIIDKGEDVIRNFSHADLKDFIKLETDRISDTHTKLQCTRCVNNIQVRPPPNWTDSTSEISCWNHCADKRGLMDLMLEKCWDTGITFVFHHRSHEQKVVP